MASYQMERGKFVELMRAKFNMTERDALALMRYASTLGRLNVIAGNVAMSDFQQRMHDAKDARITALARKIAAKYGAEIEEGGDPRGYALKLRHKELQGNTWGGTNYGDGYGVPERPVRGY